MLPENLYIVSVYCLSICSMWLTNCFLSSCAQSKGCASMGSFLFNFFCPLLHLWTDNTSWNDGQSLPWHRNYLNGLKVHASSLLSSSPPTSSRIGIQYVNRIQHDLVLPYWVWVGAAILVLAAQTKAAWLLGKIFSALVWTGSGNTLCCALSVFLHAASQTKSATWRVFCEGCQNKMSLLKGGHTHCFLTGHTSLSVHKHFVLWEAVVFPSKVYACTRHNFVHFTSTVCIVMFGTRWIAVWQATAVKMGGGSRRCHFVSLRHKQHLSRGTLWSTNISARSYLQCCTSAAAGGSWSLILERFFAMCITSSWWICEGSGGGFACIAATII